MFGNRLTKKQADFVEKHYNAMSRRLYYYARSGLADLSLSEEAVQETARIACVCIDKFMKSPDPERWLFTTLHYVIRNIKKNQKVMDKYIMPSSGLDIEEIGVYTDVTGLSLELRFGKIVESDDFKMLMRIVLNNCSMLEVSQEFGISVEACKKRIQRLKEKLKKGL